MAKELKTNAMRILDSKKIEYKTYDYEKSGYVKGSDAADVLGIERDRMFKTLVTTSHSKNHYVFVVPVEKELDLKKAAKVVNEKYVEMIPQKELLPLTGYVHGGCSPIGMK
ncbi:MAG: Cys-tRNA(Pro) deacylase, partial [Lachnospiraceae bacterium]|nr:Cys-tRNA(Pro) deacylase [Lachnospiraceae bacterium]